MPKKSSLISRKKALPLCVLRARIQNKILVHPMTGCHVWTGCTSSQYKYPTMSDGMTIVYVHRWNYEDTFGPIPRRGESGHRIELHHYLPRGENAGQCVGKSCVNPRHLKPIPADEHGRETNRERVERGTVWHLGYQRIDPAAEHEYIVRSTIYARIDQDHDFDLRPKPAAPGGAAAAIEVEVA